jgi:diguanylate cyclase (GGDEF)-like protein
MAAEHDRAADERDLALAKRDAAWGSDDRATTAAEVLLRAMEDRRRAAADRAAAATARENAAADRARAATDRERAAQERARARADREALIQQLLVAETDALTGARTRGAGLADLDHEVERARRTNEMLAVAYIDIVGLKKVNDTQGHGAGDALLQRVVDAIRRQLRSYDLIVRVGGDEFVCALSGATLPDARTRFAAVRAELARPPEACEIKVGLAELTPEASGADLIALADADLPNGKPQIQ